MGKDQEFLEAARNGNISFVEKVLGQRAKRAGPLASLRRGPGVNVQDSGGYSALHHACLNGHSDIVRLLLANEASPDLPDSRGSSALHLASWAGHEDIVKMLLTHPYRPANPNLQTIEHETPLHCAAQHGHTEALALLLAHDADPKMRNTRGETPLDLAAQYGRLQAVQMLIRAHPELIAPYTSAAVEAKSSRHSPLPHSGSVSTPSPSSPSMYSSPATPTRNIFPHTCLHLASRNGHKSVVEVLLAAGVSVNLQTPSGTALHEAALCGKESVVRTLLRADIDLNATDAEGRTALDILKEFPPHVTKHIIAVINNFRNQMDTDDGEEVVYRHHPNAGQPQQQQKTASVYRNSTNTTTSHYQQQRQHHNNHYHFNSNNHLLNHSHSMQQSSYSKPRYANSFNGGKSLDSGLQPDDSSGCGGTGGPGSSEMGVSPSSSMSSFEPASVSPRSRSSTGGLITINHHHHNPTHHPIPLGTFVPPPLPPTSAPPKKPPRRNLSVSPTHTGQHFTYTSPNHQTGQGGVYKNNPGGARRGQQTRSPSNESPYSHQSHGSVGGMSLDETQLRDRPRGDRLYASARESTRSATGITMSSSNDMLEKSNNYNETYGSNELSSSLTNSMKRPIPAPRKGLVPVSKDIINCENPTLKSYNPNRKLKRNRNSYSLGMGDKQRCSISSDSNSDPKQPLSPTNYKQPPTPDHPPPSSSHAERTIHERIRPLSQEYKRRSALLQQQQILIDSGTSPPKNFPLLPAPPAFDYAYGQTPIYHAAGLQGSSGSLSSSVSYSDQSVSTDCVEEFVGDAPFSGLLKGSTVNIGHDQSNGNGLRQQFQAMNKVVPTAPPRNLPAEDETAKQRNARPPIPTKPALLEKRVLKPPIPPTVPTVATVPNSVGKTVKHVDSETQGDVKNGNVSAAESASKDEISSCTESPPTEGQNGSSNEDSSTTTATGTENGGATSQESSILSPFNAEEARKKISEIIESFGSGILNSNITPTNDIELDFEDMEVSIERREFAVRLHQAGLFHLERMLFENGYDNYKFVNGVFDGEPDTKLMQIADKDAAKLIKLVKTLPPAEFQPQIPLKPQQENKPSSGNPVETSKGVATLVQWLNSISLPEYVESFNKHLYNTIDSVCGVWDVELQTVLQINKLGHRRRILQSLAYIRQMREPKSVKTPLAENMETNKMPSNGRLEGPSNANRSSISGYRKNRPAPQPPTSKPPASPQKNAESQQTQEPLQIRNPSELLLGLPVNLRTKWRHSANVLLKEQIKYEVQYLGSTVVKELRGTESTRKSIQKLKRDECSGTTPNQQMLLGSRNSATNRPSKRPLVCLAISHRGVEFINVDNKQTICEHEIQNINCACQDSDDLRHFAYITKENDIHYCHVFSVDSTDLATEIILTLGQAFEVAYQLALRDGIIATPLNLEPNSILQTESAAGMEAAAK